MKNFDQMLIETQDQLEAFVERAGHPEYVGIDTEFLRTDTYSPRLCLLQIATPDELVAIDCVVLENISLLREFLYHPDTTLVFHAAAQDLEILHDTFGIWPTHIFDTQIAESFLSERFQPSYGHVVKEYEHIELAKAVTLTNWERRPLCQDELAYALDDVRYLLAIARTQMERVQDLKRETWVKEELDAFYTNIQNAANPEEAWRRVRHIKNLHKKQLGVVKALALWREETAKKKNKPRRWILSDELIVQFAKHPPKTAAQVERMQGARTLSQKAIKAILEAIKNGLSHPEETLLVENPTSNFSKDVVSLAEALVRSISHVKKIAPDTLATKSEIKAHLADAKNSPLSKGWKKELVGDALSALMRGNLSLSVKNNGVVALKTHV